MSCEQSGLNPLLTLDPKRVLNLRLAIRRTARRNRQVAQTREYEDRLAGIDH